MFGSSENGTHVLACAAAMMRLSWAVVVIRGCPGCVRLFGVWRFLEHARKSDIV